MKTQNLTKAGNGVKVISKGKITVFLSLIAYIIAASTVNTVMVYVGFDSGEWQSITIWLCVLAVCLAEYIFGKAEGQIKQKGILKRKELFANIVLNLVLGIIVCAVVLAIFGWIYWQVVCGAVIFATIITAFRERENLYASKQGSDQAADCETV